ncbi:MAG TPA: hypothetical protein PKV66_06465 [Candidatus Pelethenecus sp.]|nr:hypothetical protein [Candidatus Pelethenecus sp.]
MMMEQSIKTANLKQNGSYQLTVKQLKNNPMPNKPTTLRELREKWLDFWYKESQNCEQKYLTPDTHGIIIDFLTSHSTELLRKIEGLKNSKKMRERSLISPLESYRIDDQEYGFNQALDDLLASLEDNNNEKTT